MGEFLTIDDVGVKHQFGRKENIPIYIQFVPGVVLDAVINEASAAYQEPKDINAIVAKKHYGDESQLKSTSRRKYYPLMRGIQDVPIKGDSVLLCEFGGIYYYLGPLNSLNSPNFNIDTLNTGFVPKNADGKMNSKSTFRDKFSIAKNYFIAPIQRLQKSYNPLLDDPINSKKGEEGSIAKKDTHGDMLFEGRYGNSIRIGSRGAYPLMIISNGRNIGQAIEKSYDGSLIGITSAGSLINHFGNFVLASDSIEENSRLIAGGNDSEETEKFNYNYGLEDETVSLANQIFMNSDKITLNARQNNITLSSLVNTDIGAGNNLTINTKNYTSIESSNIYLGKQAKEQKEPLVLGTRLNEFLDDIVLILESFKVTGCISGLSGPPDPATVTKINKLKQKLSHPTFLSEYHFIEDNGQKA